MKKLLWIPATFWDDHADRCPYDRYEDMPVELRRTKKRALIQAERFTGLRNDAEFYCDKDGPDQTPANIKASARATLKALAKQGA